MTDRDDPRRLALAGLIHRFAPDDFRGESLDWLCEDDSCLWYDLADNLLAAGYNLVHSASTEQEPV